VRISHNYPIRIGKYLNMCYLYIIAVNSSEFDIDDTRMRSSPLLGLEGLLENLGSIEIRCRQDIERYFRKFHISF